MILIRSLLLSFFLSSLSFLSFFTFFSSLFHFFRSPTRPQSLQTYSEHTQCVYGTFWSPRQPDVFASVSGDCTLKIWDVKAPPRSAQTIRAHDFEILTMDWNKYRDHVVVTGSVDKSIKVCGNFLLFHSLFVFLSCFLSFLIFSVYFYQGVGSSFSFARAASSPRPSLCRASSEVLAPRGEHRGLCLL